MKVRSAKKVAAGFAASAALVVGLATVGAGTASADILPDLDGPELSVEQGSYDDNNLRLNITNPNVAEGLLESTTCSSALLDGAKALEVFVALNDGDFAEVAELITSEGSTLGPIAINVPLTSPGPNANSKDVAVDDGVYFYVGTCVGIGNPGVSFTPVIVPDGIGSLAPVIDFGSLALESGSDLAAILPFFLDLIGDAGSLMN